MNPDNARPPLGFGLKTMLMRPPDAVYIPKRPQKAVAQGARVYEPKPMEIVEATRQAKRRCERGQARCWLCRQPIPADLIIFWGGKDAHRGCAETINEALSEAEQAKRERDAAESELLAG